VALIVVVVLIVSLGQSIVIIQAGTVGVVKRLGAVQAKISPGMHFIIPVLDKVFAKKR
jgi:regulator of protease activity HflC (stomatin/prohibitin superfamily)